jgi:hypothetical protein
MDTQLHHMIRRLGALVGIATALAAVVAAPGLGKARPASSYDPVVVQRMSDSWAARGGVFTNVPASSYYLPQQIESMSQGWAARGGLLPASAKVTIGRDGFDWGEFGIGAVAMLGLVLLGAGLATGAHYSRRRMRAKPAA